MIILWMLIHLGLASGFFNFNSDEASTTLSPITKKRPTLRNVTVKGKRRTDIQIQTDYLKENVDVCPEGGFYFKRDIAHSLPEVCYLCFCNITGSSVCWPRDNRKCDANHFEQHNLVKREHRHRRSPMSLSDLFIRDGVRDALGAKNTREQCKPHEASYSEGCPPADWCVGCTVCDCDANGRWDCHLLSFCSEEEKKIKKRKNKGRTYIQKSLDTGPPLPGPGVQNKLAVQQVQNLAKYIAQHGPITRRPKGKKANKTGYNGPQDNPYAEALKSPVVEKKKSKINKLLPFEKKVKDEKRKVRKVGQFKAQRLKNLTDKVLNEKRKSVKVAKNISLPKKKKNPNPYAPQPKTVKPKRKAPVQKRQAKLTTTKSPPTTKSKRQTTRKPKPKRPKRREPPRTTSTTTTPRSTTCNIQERAAEFKQRFNVQKIASQMRENLQKKLLNEVQKAVGEQVKVNKRAATKGPVVKKGIVKKNVKDNKKSNKPAPMKRSVKKTSKINVEKSNKVKLHRHKRALNDEYLAPAETINPYVIPLRVISNQTPDSNTESMHKYYKYSLDNLTSNASLANEQYLTEIIYNRTVSAKRSIDKQIEDLSNLTVVNLVDNANNTSVLVRSIVDSKNVTYSIENVTITTVKATNVKPLPIIDKRVVVIDEPHLLVDSNTTTAKEEASDQPNINITELTEFVTHVNTSYFTTVPITVQHLEASNQTQKSTPEEQKSNHTVALTESGSVPQIKPSSFMTPVTDGLKESSVVDKKIVVVKENDIKENSTLVTTTNQTISNPTTESISKSIIKTDDNFNIRVISPPNVTQAIKKTTTENYLKSEYKFEENAIVKENILQIEKNATTPGREILVNPVTEPSFKYETDDIVSLKQEIAKLKKLRKHKKAKARNKIMKQMEAEQKQKILSPPINTTKKQQIKKDDDHLNNHNHNDLHAGTDIRNDSFLNAIDINNAKINDWHHEIVKEYHSQEIKTSNKNLDKPKSKTEQYDTLKPLTAFPALKKKVNTYDLKKISIKSKKRKLTKLVATLHNRTGNDKYFLGDPSALVSNNKNSTTSDLKGFFKNLLGGLRSNKHSQSKKKSRRNRFKVIKYLQKFFKKLFSEAKHKKNKNLTNQFNKDNVIDSLCATFGPCNANVKNKAKLQPQIDHLNFETYQMLRSIKIIKGLLKLVELDKNNTKLDTNYKMSSKSKSKKAIFKSDVQKLHAILKDQYLDKQHLDKLSDTQKIQVEYIKSNTQKFIQSAAKFAVVLNDIIDVITAPDIKIKNKKGETAREEYKNKSKLVKDAKSERKRIIKSVNSTNHVDDVNEPLRKLKDLVSKYSMIQNTFMRKIYRVLTNLDTKDKKLIHASTNVGKLAQNKTEEIQVYTKNIIQNLRKLKNLAQNLSGGLRRKRELRDDDSIEYLLMLMEYLLKQNHPLDTAPVNDGIDLLIEAIKSAPDIKPIKKKVLLAANNLNLKNRNLYNRNKINNFKSQLLRNNTTSTTVKESTEVNLSREDSASDYNRISKEDNYTSNMEDTKDNVIDHSADEDENEDKMLLNRRVYTAAPVVTDTDRIIYTEPRRMPVTQVYITSSTRAPVRQTMPPRHPAVTEMTMRDTKVPRERVNNSSERVEDGKFEPFNADLEEDVSGTLTDSDLTSSTRFSTSLVETTTDVTQKMKYKHMNEKNEDASMSSSKSRIDWLDETYEEEIKAELNMSVTTETATVKHRVVTKPPSPKLNDISGFSKEVIEEGQTMKRGNAEEVMYKKEMDLLNSLDYGTEKSDVDNSDSKESNSDDKYSGDAFSSYEINK